jgi:hypothetical protein
MDAELAAISAASSKRARWRIVVLVGCDANPAREC